MNEKLIEFLQSYPSLVEVAKDLGVHRCTISCWIRGKRKVSLQNALKIEKITNGKIKWTELRPDKFGETNDG